MSKRALILGISGQDGAYLAHHLLQRGYDVTGTTRGQASPLDNLVKLEIADAVRVETAHPGDEKAMECVIAAAAPDEIYALAAQSSVAASFADPVESLAAAAHFALLCRLTSGSDVRILHAASGDCFGEASVDRPITETSPFAPRSPYAVGKVAAACYAALVRETESRFVVNAFLFNHESPLRPAQFVTGRIAAVARRIADGSDETLELGDVGVVRDWGWAPDYVDAMHRMLIADAPADFVIATGRSVPLSHLVERIFAALGLDWREYVRVDAFPPRQRDIRRHFADPTAIADRLGWRAAHDVDAVAVLLARST